MNAKQVYRLQIILLAVLVIVFVVSFFNASSNMQKAGNQLKQKKTEASQLEYAKNNLINAKQDIDKYKDITKIAKAVVPEDKNQAVAVREIVNLASQNGITLSSINFPASNLGSSLNTGMGSAPSKKDSLSQLKQVAKIPGVYELMINVESDPSKPVAYDKFINFLAGLEKNRRTAQVNSITLTPSSNDSNQVAFVINLNEYIKP